MVCFCGVSDDVQAVSVLRLSLVSVLICHEHLCKGMAYTCLVFTDNQAGKHKDRRKNSVDAKAVSSRTSEGEWQTTAWFPGDHAPRSREEQAPGHPPHRSAPF